MVQMEQPMLMSSIKQDLGLLSQLFDVYLYYLRRVCAFPSGV